MQGQTGGQEGLAGRRKIIRTLSVRHRFVLFPIPPRRFPARSFLRSFFSSATMLARSALILALVHVGILPSLVASAACPYAHLRERTPSRLPGDGLEGDPLKKRDYTPPDNPDDPQTGDSGILGELLGNLIPRGTSKKPSPKSLPLSARELTRPATVPIPSSGCQEGLDRRSPPAVVRTSRVP